jgi:hypothetical protein
MCSWEGVFRALTREPARRFNFRNVCFAVVFTFRWEPGWTDMEMEPKQPKPEIMPPVPETEPQRSPPEIPPDKNAPERERPTQGEK